LVRQHFAPLRPLTRDVLVPCGGGVRLLAHYTAAAPAAPLIILIHGWEGSAESVYLLAATQQFHAAGYSVLRLNLRDHGASHHLNEDLFHSCRLQEVVDAVGWAAAHYRPDRLLVGGFSLGGNFALRVAAVAPENGIKLDRVLAVCPVLDPTEAMDALDSGWFVYRWYFLQKWRASLMKKMAAFPEVYDFSKLRSFSTLTEMTEHFVVNHTEYATLHDYLNGYSLLHGRLAKLEVDSRVLLAADDPIIPVAGLHALDGIPALHAEVVRYGGHCGFLESWRLESWVNDWLLRAASAP
jgi:predicted alpha/beta-fold hydrolase